MKMKTLLASFLFVGSTLLLFSGCNGANPIPGIGQELKEDPKLPVIDLTARGLVVEMNEIAFEWKPVEDMEVEGIKVYRAVEDANVTTLVKTIENRYSTHFVDLDVKPDTKYTYELRTYKGDAVSQKSKKITIYSKPPLPSVSWIYAKNGLPRMGKILWRPHKNQAVEKYIIERKAIDDEEWERIATLKGRLQAEYIDTGLKDKHTYRYRVRVETFDGIVSTPSEIVKVVTKPLPPVVTGLQATTDLPKKIFLTWNKSNYKDFERYYLYRSDAKNGRYELIAKLYNNRFTDEIGEDGAKYFYKVAQRDIDGLESKKDDFIVMGSTLPKPYPPTFDEARFDGSAVHLRWFRVDPRSRSYIVERKAKTGWFDEKTDHFKTTSKTFVDRNLSPNTTYTYRVYAVDGNKILSKPSQPVTVEVTELKAALSDVVRTSSKKRPKTKAAQPLTTEEVAPIDGLEVDSE